jgi:hypothetical protein
MKEYISYSFTYGKHMIQSEKHCPILSTDKSGILVTLIMLLKMCLNTTNSKVYIGTHLTDVFPIHDGLKQDAELTLLTLFQYMPLPMSNKIRAEKTSRKTQLLAYVVLIYMATKFCKEKY